MHKQLLNSIAIIMMVFGILITIFGSRNNYQMYAEQNNWIKVEGQLTDIERNYDTNTTYTGVYMATIDDKNIRFTGEDKTSKTSVKDSLSLYINPENYNEYHLEIYKYSWVAVAVFGIAIIAFSAILMMFIIPKTE